MLQPVLPSPGQPRRLPFFLAMEEWTAVHLPEEECFFVWQQGGPTVICGRNQDIPSEVDLPYCRREGIDVVRRRSGGGAVVADENNFMFSYVCPLKGRKVEEIFSSYTRMIATALCQLGIEAEAGGRNDITVGGRKVSGGAFYLLPDHAIAHSTMLYSLPSPKLMASLTPGREKLGSKGVPSVASRITSLRDEGLRLSREDFADAMTKAMCGAKRILSESDIAEIEAIEKAYYKPEFLRIEENNDNKSDSRISGRRLHKAGLGQIEASWTSDSDGRISRPRIRGDFFEVGSVRFLEKALDGLRPEDIITSSLEPGSHIRGLDKEILYELFIP